MFIIAPFLIIGLVSAYQSSESIKHEVGKTMLELVNQNHVTLEKSLSLVNDKTLTLLDNHFFSNPEQYRYWTGIETLSQIREADSILERWSSDGTEYEVYMKNVEGKQTPYDLMSKDAGFKYIMDDPAHLPEWAKRSFAQGAGVSLQLLGVDGRYPTVNFVRPILNPKDYGETLGLLVVSNLDRLLRRDLISVQIPEQSGIFLLNSQDELLIQVGDEKLSLPELPVRSPRLSSDYFFVKEDNRNWLYAYSRKPAYATTLIYKVPLEAITGKQHQFTLTMILTSLIYLVFVLIFVLFLIKVIVKPLVKLVEATKIYEPGSPMFIQQELLRTDEFGVLYGAFLKMTRRLDRSIEENYIMNLKAKEHELSMLHSQMTPHLLYNTLDSIYWYAYRSGNQLVSEMVRDLSKLLRIGLSKGRTTITIQEELEHVQAYCRLQAKRYPNTFEVAWEIDEGVESVVVPKIIMQPLVENAIFHGVNSMDGEGMIWIRVMKRDHEVLLQVEDNGFMQVDTDRLNTILQGDGTEGYGIRNVHQRIQLHYGSAFGLHYDPREGGGVTATITLPLHSR